MIKEKTRKFRKSKIIDKLFTITLIPIFAYIVYATNTGEFNRVSNVIQNFFSTNIEFIKSYLAAHHDILAALGFLVTVLILKTIAGRKGTESEVMKEIKRIHHNIEAIKKEEEEKIRTMKGA